jgi:tetratricopeptide (TPR) repeat protein
VKRGILLLPALTLLVVGCGSSNASRVVAPTAVSEVAPTRAPTVKDPRRNSKPRPTATPTRIKIPRNGTAFQKGLAYLRAGLYDMAAQQFQLSIQHHQSMADSYANLGTIAIAQANYAQAYLNFQSAVQLQPKNSAYLYYAAFAALRAQDFSDAGTYATRYIAIDPKNPAGYHLRFLAYRYLMNRKGQVQDAQTLAQLQPKSAGAFNDLGIALTNDGKFPQAIQAFTRAIQLLPKNGTYYANRAQAENFNNQPKLALQDLETARSLAKDPQTRQQVDQAIFTLCQTSQPTIAKVCPRPQVPAGHS